MAFQPSEQLVQDKINLSRLLRRLEKTVSSHEWEEETRQAERATWFKNKGMLQSLQYARKLLKNVEQNDIDGSPSSAQKYQELSATIDQLERKLIEVDKSIAPKPSRQTPILPTLPLPPPSSRGLGPETVPIGHDKESHSAMLEPSDHPTVAAQDLLLSPADAADLPPSTPVKPPTTLLPASMPTSSETASTTAAGGPAFLQNSAALQEEMAEQLARMATQLKRNAVHFAGSLEKDKAVVQEAHEKMERNFDVMSKERVRLRDHRSKSWGTTWLVVLSLLVAAIGFMMTFAIIRIT